MTKGIFFSFRVFFRVSRGWIVNEIIFSFRFLDEFFGFWEGFELSCVDVKKILVKFWYKIVNFSYFKIIVGRRFGKVGFVLERYFVFFY